MKKKSICVVIPCYKVKDKIYKVVKKINFKIVDHIIVVDDFCPEKSVHFLKKSLLYKNKISYIFLKKNLGVGGATIAGFNAAIKKNFKYVIKLDGDGQHEPKILKTFIKKLEIDKFNCCKGYRELNLFNLKGMPFIRFLGNISLTLISRVISGNFQLKDITNGLIGIETKILKKIDLKRIKNNFFFEQDLLFHLVMKKTKISQVKVKIIYENEKSNLKPIKTILPFIVYHLENLIYRIFR